MGRTSDAKEKILDAARSLIDRRGYSALGVAEICQTAGVPKGSFYYFFESKEALALAVLDQQWAVQQRDWSRVLNDVAAEPHTRLRGLFELTEATLREGKLDCGTVSGCMFGNLTLELSSRTEPIRDRLQQIFEAQVGMVEKVVVEAGERGQAAVGDAHRTAISIVAQLEGQVLFAKLYNDTHHLEALWDNCLALLGAQRQGAQTPNT